MPGATQDLVSPYTCTVTFRWGDQDAYGHVNNVQILRILEDARVIAFHDWFGHDRSQAEPTMLDEGVLVARHEIEYLRPLTFAYEPVEVDVWVTTVGGGSFDVGYRLRPVGQTSSRAAYALAETTLVLYDFAARRPRRLVGEQRAVVESLLGPAVPFRRRH